MLAIVAVVVLVLVALAARGVRRRRRAAESATPLVGRLPADGSLGPAIDVLHRIGAASLERPIEQLAVVSVGEAAGGRVADRLRAAAGHEGMSLALLVVDDPAEAAAADAVVLAGADADLRGRDARRALRTLGRGDTRLLGLVVLDTEAASDHAEGPDERVDLAAELERAGVPLTDAPSPVAAPRPEPVRVPFTVPPSPPPRSVVDDREQALDARVASLTRRELALARHAAEQEARERRLATRELRLAEQLRQLDELPVATARGTRNLSELEHAVAAARSRGDSVEEWEAYLEALRPMADAAGQLPEELDPLVESVFGAAPG